MTTPDAIPLPEHLQNCGCEHAKAGIHATSCVPAREFDAIPLSEREGYAPGVRFRAITWQFPLRFTTTVHVEVEVDPELYLREHQAEYDAFEVPEGSGYAPWEKPMVFLTNKITDDLDVDLYAFDGRRFVSRVDSHLGDIDERPRWGEADTNRLHAALAADPNQETLDV